MQTTLSLEDDSMEATSVTKIGIIGVGNVGSMILEVLSNSEHSGGYLSTYSTDLSTRSESTKVLRT